MQREAIGGGETRRFEWREDAAALTQPREVAPQLRRDEQRRKGVALSNFADGDDRLIKSQFEGGGGLECLCVEHELDAARGFTLGRARGKQAKGEHEGEEREVTPSALEQYECVESFHGRSLPSARRLRSAGGESKESCSQRQGGVAIQAKRGSEARTSAPAQAGEATLANCLPMGQEED